MVLGRLTASGNPVLEGVKQHLPAGLLRRVKRARIRRSYRQPLVSPVELERRFVEALRWLEQREPHGELGDYLEFGVCHGTSMMCMYRALLEVQAPGPRLFGFDSFEGLPPEASLQDDGVFGAGWYPSDLDVTKKRMTAQGADWGRITLVPGWFSDTLTSDFRTAADLRHASVVMVDCDIYSSTVEALEFTEPLIRDQAVIVFDDWNSFDLADRGLGQRKAWDELLEQHHDLVEVDELDAYNANSRIVCVERRF